MYSIIHVHVHTCIYTCMYMGYVQCNYCVPYSQFVKTTLQHKIILNECLYLGYSVISYRKPVKCGIQEDQLMLLLDTEFHWLLVQDGQIAKICICCYEPQVWLSQNCYNIIKHVHAHVHVFSHTTLLTLYFVHM